MLPGQLVLQTAHLDIYRLEGGLAVSTLEAMAPKLEDVIGSVGERINGGLVGRVAISFEPPATGPCALRGLTYSHERRIQLFYAPDTPEPRVLAIVAHELAHQIQHDRYGWDAHQRSDSILLEGQATWASGDFDLGEGEGSQPAWDRQAREALVAGNLPPLSTNLESDCRQSTRIATYSGWAAFVDFLLVTYGQELFDKLYLSGNGHYPGSSEYRSILGKDLQTLEQDWHVWLSSTNTQRTELP